MPMEEQLMVMSQDFHFTPDFQILTACMLDQKVPETQPSLSITTNVLTTAPVVGPSHPPKEHIASEELSFDARSSPASASRALIHDLTLPPVPNLDIPPSPPGSPDTATSAKFAHFLNLKKKGVHFNKKMAISASLKNPSLLQKLREHAGIDKQAQYSTSLPIDVWDPSYLPQWGFKEELLKTQQEVRRNEEKRLAGQRTSIDFVSGASHTENRTRAT